VTHSKKIFFLFTHIILFFSLFILFGNCFVYAIDDFKTICGTTYRVSEDLKASVTQEISLVNLKPDLYVSQYSLLLGGDQIVNVAGWDRLGPLTIKVEKKGEVKKTQRGGV